MDNLLALDSWVLERFQKFTNYMSDTWGVSKGQLLRSCNVIMLATGMVFLPAYYMYVGESSSSLIAFVSTFFLLLEPSHEQPESDPVEVIDYKMKTSAYGRTLWLLVTLVWICVGCILGFQKNSDFGILGFGILALLMLIKCYIEGTTSPPRKKSKAKEALERVQGLAQRLLGPKVRLAINTRSPRRRGLPLFYLILLITLYFLLTN